MPLPLTRESERFDVPDKLPVMPLRDVVVFPYMVIPLLVGRPASLAAVETALTEDRWIFLVAQKSAEVNEPGARDLFRTGVIGRVLQVARNANGTTKVLVEGVGRARVTRYTPGEKHLRAQVEVRPFRDHAPTPDEHAQIRRVVTLFDEYVSMHRRIPGEVAALVQGAQSVDKQAFAVAAHLLIKLEQRQKLLEATNMRALCTELGETLVAENEILRLERKIDNDVRGSLFQNQREFYLQEQLKAIHKELGQEEGDGFDELQAAIDKKNFPAPVKERAERELRKLRRSSPLSPEATVGRNYLDWLIALPWNERSDDVVDVAHARTVLDEDHFGLEDVKERVLDYIAVLALVGRMEGPILCLVGPPGVGKTSLGRSIARALGRKFVRMSLGGVRDEAEIRGHRRTYIGSLPGRVVQAMRRAEVVNPVILLDEVDKMGQDWRGDPAAALLEVLDPEQNRAFNDHYLEVDYDLSHVLFLTTANSLSAIPEALRDRMEVIRLAGYVDHEKFAIARQFLVPKQLKAHGLDPAKVTFTADAIPAITRLYTREAGVRELERRLARVARKLARKAAADPANPPAMLTVSAADLTELLGVAPFDADEPAREDRVGVATGLAYTSIGGDLLEIEVAVVRGRGRLQLTGTLGDVLKESANAAITYARSRASVLGFDAEFPKTRDVHVHIPDGATPKDGPSAGIGIAVAVISALTGVPVRGDTAMTGEITLRGRVLPIGGLKEKLVAARRAGITQVIIPEQNERELAEIPDDIKGGITFHPVKTMDEVLTVALRGDKGAAVARGAGAAAAIAAAVPPPHTH